MSSPPAAPAEDLYGVFWDDRLRSQDGPGYALAITSQRLVAARKTQFFKGSFRGYIGPNSKASGENITKTKELADQIIAGTFGDRKFEFRKEDISRVTLDTPQLWSGRLVLDTTQQGQIEIRIFGVPGQSISSQIATGLRKSLLAFVPDKFYNAKTGMLFADEIRQKAEKKQEKQESKQAKKHWW